MRVSRKAVQPFVLDESICDVPALLRAIKDSMLNAIVLKISNVGGISKARTIIKICIATGIRMRIEDTTGSEFVKAAVAHLAASVPPASLLCSYEHCFEEICTADGAPQVKNGRISLSMRPGLGVTPKYEVLKEPVAVYE